MLLRRNQHHYCTAQTHENIRIKRQASDILFSIRRSRISCDSRQLYESSWSLHSSVILFPRKCMKQELMNGTPPGSNHECTSFGVDTERGFHSVVSSLHQTYEADKIRSLYLSTGRAPTHTRNLDVITLHRENNVEIIGLPPHNSHRMQPLDKACTRPLKTFYCEEIKKIAPLKPRAGRHFYQIGEQFGNAYKRPARSEIAANDFRERGRFPCDKNIFRPHDIPLAS